LLGTLQGHSEVSLLLLDHGAGIDVPSKDGKTALHYAAQQVRLHVT
jgi:ankyrin repeat protein